MGATGGGFCRGKSQLRCILRRTSATMSQDLSTKGRALSYHGTKNSYESYVGRWRRQAMHWLIATTIRGAVTVASCYLFESIRASPWLQIVLSAAASTFLLPLCLPLL